MLSINDISKMTGIDKRGVSRELKATLVARMTLPGGSGNPATSSKIVRRINKDYDRWVVARTPGGGKEATTPSGKDARGSRTRAYKQRKTSTPQPEVAALSSQFVSLLQIRVGEKPIFNWGMAGKLFGTLLRLFPLDEIKKRMTFWFNSTNHFATGNFGVAAFYKNFNRLKDGPILLDTTNKKQIVGTPSWM